MEDWLAIPWLDILRPQHPVEMIVRGSLTYLGLLVILRVVLKRQAGSLALSDLLVTVLIADAIQNAMAGDYKSVPDGLLLVTTIVVWDYLVDYLSYRSRTIRRFITEPPLLLIDQGKMLRRHMRRELITEEELWAKLRQEGISKLEEVKTAFLESDGEISVIKKDQD